MKASDFLLFSFALFVSISAFSAMILLVLIVELWPVFALIAGLKIYGWLILLGAL
jgi:hypothetical protein